MSVSEAKSGWIDVKWQHWFASILLTVLLPLLPLLFEYLIKHKVSDGSLLVAATIYCCTLGLASTSVLVITMGVVVSVVLSVLFGLASSIVDPLPAYSAHIAWICIGFFAIVHSIGRFDIHVTQGRDVLDFRRNGQ